MWFLSPVVSHSSYSRHLWEFTLLKWQRKTCWDINPWNLLLCSYLASSRCQDAAACELWPVRRNQGRTHSGVCGSCCHLCPAATSQHTVIGVHFKWVFYRSVCMCMHAHLCVRSRWVLMKLHRSSDRRCVFFCICHLALLKLVWLRDETDSGYTSCHWPNHHCSHMICV